MAAEKVVTELVIDAAGAVAGAAKYDAAMSRAEKAADRVVLKQDAIDKAVEKVTVTLDRKAQRLSQVQRQYQNLEATANPVIAAQQRYERAVATTERAVRLGITTQEEAARTLSQLQTRLQATAVTAERTAGAVQRSGMAFRGFGGAMQQVGYQVGDFAVQVASGQGIIRPLIQQGTQIVSVFGAWGAVLGAAGAIVGALAVALLDLGDSTDTTKKAQEDLNKAYEDYFDIMGDEEGRAQRRSEQRILETQGILAQAIATRDLAIAELELKRNRVEELESAAAAASTPGIPSQLPGIDSRLVDLRKQNKEDQTFIDLLELKRQTDSYFADVARGLKQQADLTKELSDFERDSAEARAKDEKDLAAERKKSDAERLKAAKAQADELNRWLDLQQEVLKGEGERIKAQTEVERGQIAANDNLEDYIKKLEDAATVDGRTTQEKKIQQAIIEAQNKLYDKQGDKIRDLEQAEKDRISVAVRQTDEMEQQRKKIEDQGREIERVAQRAEDQISDAFGDTFFDYLTGKTTSFWETFKNLGLRAISGVAANAVVGTFLSGPIRSGISALMGGTSLFGPSGMVSAGSNGGGQIAGTANGGGFGNLLSFGDLFSFANGGNSGIGGGGSWIPGMDSITGSINAFGASYLGLNGAGAAQAAASTYGISAGQAAALSNSGALGSTASLSGILGAAGLGFAGGSLLASLTGGNAMGGGIGGGIGAGAGFLIGGPVGAIIGGVGGSLIGGLFGGKKKRPIQPSGWSKVGVTEDGRYYLGETMAEAADPGVTIAGAQQVVQSMNQLLDRYELVATGGTYVTQGSATGPQSAEAAIADLIQRGRFTSDDPVMKQIIGATGSRSIEGIVADLDFGLLYKQTVELQRAANQTRDAFEALSKTFDENIEKVKSFDLSVENFTKGTAANFDQEIGRAIKGIVDPLGLALDDFTEIEAARLDYARKIGADIAEVERLNMLERMQILQQGGADLNTWLKGQILGPTSTLTGGGRLAEAQSQFGSAVEAARSGTGGIGDVTRLADIILGFSSELYGGTKQAAFIEQTVRSTVQTLGRDLGLPGFAEGGYHDGGLRIVGERGPEIEATGPARYWNQQQIGQVMAAAGSGDRSVADRAIVRSSTEVANEIRALRKDIAAANEENRALRAQMSRLLNKGRAA